MRRVRLPLLAVTVIAAVLMSAPSAEAACHAFTVGVEPAQVAEGGKVTVTVTRDAAVNPSQVDVSSVDVTAKGGEDYPAQKRTVSFTTDTRQSFEIPITDDPASEGDETFKLHLSNPGGCAVNPNFSVGPDATVTIQQSDGSGTTAAPATTVASTAAPASQPPGPRTTASNRTTVPTSAGTSAPAVGTETTASTTTTATSTTLPRETDEAAASSDDDGSAGVVVAAAVVALAALVGVGYLVYRRRRSTSN